MDVIVDGARWGIEVALGANTPAAKNEAERSRIEVAIREKLLNDSAFQSAFGRGHLVVHLDGDSQPLSRALSLRIIAELGDFIARGAHRKGDIDGCFDSPCRTLRSRGASFGFAGEDGDPYFSA
jgi:hypothetical protein